MGLANSLSVNRRNPPVAGPEPALQAHHDGTEWLSPVRMAPSRSRNGCAVACVYRWTGEAT